MCSCRNCSSCGQYGEQAFLFRNRRGIHEAQQETFDGICSSGRGRICLPPACVCSGCGLHDGYGQCRRRRRRQVSRDDEHNHGAGDQGARLRDLSDILSQVLGLYMAPAAKDSKMVRVRGASSDQTKVYIDGIPAFPLNGIVSNAASDLSTIPADSIAKVEIIKGPGPVQYGTDYKGGVILVTTKDGRGPGKFRVSVAGGANHTFDTKLGYSGSDKNISYAVNLSRHYSAGYLENQTDKKLYFDGKIRFKTSNKSSLTLNGYYSDMDREVPESVDPATGQYVAPRGPRWSVQAGNNITPNHVKNNNATDWHFKGFRQSNIALRYESRPNDIWQYDVKYYHMIDENNLWVRNLLATEGGSLPFFTHGAPQWYRSGWFLRGNGVEANASVAYNSRNVLSFGAKYIKLSWNTDENNTSYRRDGNDARRSFYVENAWSPSRAGHA